MSVAENGAIKFNWKFVKNYRLAFAFWAPVEDGDDGGISPGEGVEAIFFDWIGIQFFSKSEIQTEFQIFPFNPLQDERWNFNFQIPATCRCATEVNSALFVYLLENWHWQVELKPQSYMLNRLVRLTNFRDTYLG